MKVIAATYNVSKEGLAMSTAPGAFLHHLIDYAGLFPPAQLPLDVAVRNYAQYRKSPEKWMLGRFVCPAARLAELEAFQGELAGASLVVLGRGGSEPQEFFDHVRADIADMRRVRLPIDGYEVRLPQRLLQPARPHPLSALIGTVAFLLETSGLAPLSPFFECPVLDADVVRTLIEVMLADRHSPQGQQRKICGPPGWKLRCGGDSIPTCKQIALILAACCAADIPWKATAGLHHPLRHDNAHGFVNVVGAAILAHAGQIDEVQMEQMLADENKDHFRLDDTGFAWRTFRAGTSQIEAGRRRLATSFGSCSFDEPRDDLRRLGWL